MLMTKHTVAGLRAEMDIDQSELAVEARVTQPTISNLESGKPVQRRTAYKVYFALNRLRQAHGLTRIEFEDIAWNLT